MSRCDRVTRCKSSDLTSAHDPLRWANCKQTVSFLATCDIGFRDNLSGSVVSSRWPGVSVDGQWADPSFYVDQCCLSGGAGFHAPSGIDHSHRGKRPGGGAAGHSTLWSPPRQKVIHETNLCLTDIFLAISRCISLRLSLCTFWLPGAWILKPVDPVCACFSQLLNIVSNTWTIGRAHHFWSLCTK